MHKNTGPILYLLVLLIGFYNTEAARIRVQPRYQQQQQQQEDIDDSIQYYAAEPQEQNEEAADNRQRVILVSPANQYSALYGQQTAAQQPASSRSSSQENYIPRGSTKATQQLISAQRVKEAPRTPPVQTIRNYNKVNDDGSFTFGYEAADGSFKEETRGTDCVVRGKYGYVDPDGNKREFTYVSGNPCDPNAPKEEEEEDTPENPEDENIPANYPSRQPIRPLPRPVSTVAPRPVTLFQNTYEQSEDEQPEPEQLLRPTPSPKPQYISRPQYVQAQTPVYQKPQIVPSTTPASAIYRQQYQPISITPKTQYQTALPTVSTRTQLPATTYKPQQIFQVSATPRPALLYTPKPVTVAPSKGIDFEAEFQRFQQENNLISPTPSPASKQSAASIGQIYSSALIYDPATGQYKNQLYQSLPQTEGDFRLNQRIQPYVQQPQRTAANYQQIQQPSNIYRQQVAQQQQQQVVPQAIYQAQQSELQFQNSAQLYAQQQKAREQQAASQKQLQLRPPASPVYYIQPSGALAGSGGQIDAFLRGHNIQF